MEKNKLPAMQDAPWMVTQVQAQLDAMAGACNELYRANRQIKFIVPIISAESQSAMERPTSHIAIFSMPTKHGRRKK